MSAAITAALMNAACASADRPVAQAASVSPRPAGDPAARLLQDIEREVALLQESIVRGAIESEQLRARGDEAAAEALEAEAREIRAYVEELLESMEDEPGTER